MNPPYHIHSVTPMAVAVLLAIGGAAHAQVLILDLPDLVLQRNQAGQTFTFALTRSGPSPELTGVQLELVVADGGPQAGGTINGPWITGGSVTQAGLLFGGNNVGETGSGNDFGTPENPAIFNQLFQLKTSTASGPVTMATESENLATVTFSTIGISPGVYTWGASGGPNGTSFFTGTEGQPVIIPQLQNGTLTVVPEPSHYALIGGAGLAAFSLWRRTARKSVAEGNRLAL